MWRIVDHSGIQNIDSLFLQQIMSPVLEEDEFRYNTFRGIVTSLECSKFGFISDELPASLVGYRTNRCDCVSLFVMCPSSKSVAQLCFELKTLLPQNGIHPVQSVRRLYISEEHYDGKIVGHTGDMRLVIYVYRFSSVITSKWQFIFETLNHFELSLSRNVLLPPIGLTKSTMHEGSWTLLRFPASRILQSYICRVHYKDWRTNVQWIIAMSRPGSAAMQRSITEGMSKEAYYYEYAATEAHSGSPIPKSLDPPTLMECCIGRLLQTKDAGEYHF